MLYYTNQELAEANHVSVRTVRNWIDSAREGKVDLLLQEKGQRHYIANTSKNTLIIRDLVSKNKKYRPHRSQKTVMPQSRFYDLYTQAQLYDIVSNLEINHEIPRQYNYFGDGAEYWDSYATHLAEEDTPNTLKATIELLEKSSKYFDYILQKYKQINVIDIGVGNALPVKDFLNSLLEKGKLGRYIAIDISPKILDIAEENIKKWFGDRVVFERHELDFTHDRFGNLLAQEYIKSTSDDTCNLMLFLGGTLPNFKKPATVLEVLHDSMGVNDYLVHSQKLDTLSSRRYFDFNSNPTSSNLAPMLRYMFDLLNIDESLCEVRMGFDDKLNERYVRAVFKIALSIRFAFQGGERVLSFNKGDDILLWRARQSTLLDITQLLSNNDFYPVHISETTDQEFVLTISRIQHDNS